MPLARYAPVGPAGTTSYVAGAVLGTQAWRLSPLDLAALGRISRRLEQLVWRRPSTPGRPDGLWSRSGLRCVPPRRVGWRCAEGYEGRHPAPGARLSSRTASDPKWTVRWRRAWFVALRRLGGAGRRAWPWPSATRPVRPPGRRNRRVLRQDGVGRSPPCSGRRVGATTRLHAGRRPSPPRTGRGDDGRSQGRPTWRLDHEDRRAPRTRTAPAGRSRRRVRRPRAERGATRPR